jgi:hypothetical protein
MSKSGSDFNALEQAFDEYMKMINSDPASLPISYRNEGDRIIGELHVAVSADVKHSPVAIVKRQIAVTIKHALMVILTGNKEQKSARQD